MNGKIVKAAAGSAAGGATVSGVDDVVLCKLPSKKTAYKCAGSILGQVNAHLKSAGFEKVSVTTVYRRILLHS
jgi:hypothetical protein